MSNIYIQEPPTNGKVILHTTVGPIDVELWSKEAPRACRNFVQLCLEGYYDGTIFHRLIKGMCVQGGDPTGTGEGGQSIYGKPFRDELHSRLRFVRRGLVAMASAGKDDNGSQFFFTLGATPHLNNKHTIFGKVGGDTVYNMLKLEDADVDEDDRPEFPQKIRRTEVVDNPFPDIQPRRSRDKESASKAEDSSKKNRDKGKKDFKLLSFGDEAEEEEEELTEIVVKQFRGKSKSSHDLLKDDKTLSAQPAVLRDDIVEDATEETAKASKKQKDGSKESEAVERIREKMKDKSSSVTDNNKDKANRSRNDRGNASGRTEELTDVNVENYFEEERKRKARKEVEEIRSEYKKLKKEIKESDQKKKSEQDQAAIATGGVESDAKIRQAQEAAGDNDLLASFFAEQAQYSSSNTSSLKKAPKTDREAATLAMLERFKAKLHNRTTVDSAEHTDDRIRHAADKQSGNTSSSSNNSNMREKAKGKTSGQDGGNISDDGEDDWMRHELRFQEQGPVLAKDATMQKEDMYDITDPRHPLNARKRNELASRRRTDPASGGGGGGGSRREGAHSVRGSSGGASSNVRRHEDRTGSRRR